MLAKVDVRRCKANIINTRALDVQDRDEEVIMMSYATCELFR
jgi:hypothetical protein